MPVVKRFTPVVVRDSSIVRHVGDACGFIHDILSPQASQGGSVDDEFLMNFAQSRGGEVRQQLISWLERRNFEPVAAIIADSRRIIGKTSDAVDDTIPAEEDRLLPTLALILHSACGIQGEDNPEGVFTEVLTYFIQNHATEEQPAQHQAINEALGGLNSLDLPHVPQGVEVSPDTRQYFNNNFGTRGLPLERENLAQRLREGITVHLQSGVDLVKKYGGSGSTLALGAEGVFSESGSVLPPPDFTISEGKRKDLQDAGIPFSGESLAQMMVGPDGGGPIRDNRAIPACLALAVAHDKATHGGGPVTVGNFCDLMKDCAHAIVSGEINPASPGDDERFEALKAETGRKNERGVFRLMVAETSKYPEREVAFRALRMRSRTDYFTGDAIAVPFIFPERSQDGRRWRIDDDITMHSEQNTLQDLFATMVDQQGKISPEKIFFLMLRMARLADGHKQPFESVGNALERMLTPVVERSNPAQAEIRTALGWMHQGNALTEVADHLLLRGVFPVTAVGALVGNETLFDLQTIQSHARQGVLEPLVRQIIRVAPSQKGVDRVPDVCAGILGAGMLDPKTKKILTNVLTEESERFGNTIAREILARLKGLEQSHVKAQAIRLVTGTILEAAPNEPLEPLVRDGLPDAPSDLERKYLTCRAFMFRWGLPVSKNLGASVGASRPLARQVAAWYLTGHPFAAPRAVEVAYRRIEQFCHPDKASPALKAWPHRDGAYKTASEFFSVATGSEPGKLIPTVTQIRTSHKQSKGVGMLPPEPDPRAVMTEHVRAIETELESRLTQLATVLARSAAREAGGGGEVSGHLLQRIGGIEEQVAALNAKQAIQERTVLQMLAQIPDDANPQLLTLRDAILAAFGKTAQELEEFRGK
ncbi:MAG: hypothetical protein ABH851_07790 [Methanobacteriota archaeon]